MKASDRPTMLDVARSAGVSIKTVSRVVNGEPNVSAETAARVQVAVRQLGFRRNDMARSLRSGRPPSTIGLVIPDLGNPFYSAMARGAEQVAQERGSLLVVGSSEDDVDREHDLVATLFSRRVDGLLLVSSATEHATLRAETQLGTPVVFIDRAPVGLAADVVLIDNVGGGRLAGEHLASHGHRRIGVVGDSSRLSTMRERLEGFEGALRARGVRLDPALIRFGAHTAADAEADVASLMSVGSPPTALFLLNNRMTLGAVRAIQAASLSVEVVGFDDFETRELLRVPVTVVAHDPAQMGRSAAALLYRRVDTPAARRRRVIVPTRLRVGEPSPRS